MGIFGKRKDGRFYHVDNKDGQIHEPIGTNKIGTPLHSTQQESKFRLIANQLTKNQYIRESYADRHRLKLEKNARNDKIEADRQKQFRKSVEMIEAQKALLRQAEKDPTVLDKLNEADIKSGVIPEGHKAEQAKKQQEFFKVKEGQLNEQKDRKEKEIKDVQDKIKENHEKVTDLKEKLQELRQHSSNIPEINQRNTDEMNKLTFELNRFEKANESLASGITGTAEEFKKISQELGDVRNLKHNTTLQTTATGSDNSKPTIPLEVEKNRFSSKKDYEREKERLTGEGVSKVFPKGYQHATKIWNPIKKEYEYTHAPKNETFVGFDRDGEPKFADIHQRKHIEPEDEGIVRSVGQPHDIPEPRSEEDILGAKRFSIIPGFVKERE